MLIILADMDPVAIIIISVVGIFFLWMFTYPFRWYRKYNRGVDVEGRALHDLLNNKAQLVTKKSRRKDLQANIFVSYNREGHNYMPGIIYDKLVAFFGRGPIYLDVDTIPLGIDFTKHLNKTIKNCEVMVVCIAQNWVEKVRDPKNFARLEVEWALRKDIAIIPVLLDGLNMPSRNVLPPSLQDLTVMNGLQVRPAPDIERDIELLIDEIEDHLS